MPSLTVSAHRGGSVVGIVHLFVFLVVLVCQTGHEFLGGNRCLDYRGSLDEQVRVVRWGFVGGAGGAGWGWGRRWG